MVEVAPPYCFLLYLGFFAGYSASDSHSAFFVSLWLNFDFIFGLFFTSLRHLFLHHGIISMTLLFTLISLRLQFEFVFEEFLHSCSILNSSLLCCAQANLFYYVSLDRLNTEKWDFLSKVQPDVIIIALMI